MADKVAPYGIAGLVAGADKQQASPTLVAGLGAKVAKARAAGYSDADIAAHLGKDPALAPKIQAARKAGYGDGDIVGFLADPSAGAKARARKQIAAEYAKVDNIPLFGRSSRSTEARARGATFGLMDELSGGAYAAGNAVANAFAPMFGKPGSGLNNREAYEVARDVSRERDKAYAQAHPVDNFVEKIAGGAWAPGAKFIGGAPNLASAGIRAAGVGGAYGAVAGAAEAQDGLQSRVQGGATGAAIGAALGGAAPLVGRGGQAALRRIGGAASEAGERIVTGLGRELNALSPKQIERGGQNALQYVAGLAKSAPKNALATNPIEAAGKPVTAAEALGRQGMSQLGAVARRSGQTGEVLESALRQRQQAMPERVLNDMSKATGLTPEAAAGDVEHLVEAGRKEAGPLFKSALSSVKGPLDTPEIKALKGRPVIKKALASVASDMLNAGEDPNAAGLVVKGMDANGLPDVVEVRGAPAETWDAVRRAVGRQVERNPVTGRPLPDSQSQGNYGVNTATRDLTLALRKAIPGYEEALAKSADYLKVDAAFNNARRLMGPEVPTSAFGKAFDALSPTEQKAHIAGFVNEAYQRAMNGRMRLSDMRSPAFVAKLTKMIGKERADGLLANLEHEVQLARGGRMSPATNSVTAETLMADREQTQALEGLAGAAKTAARGKWGQAAMQAVASPIVGAYRGAQVPIDRATRDEVGRLLQLSPSELDAVLTAAAKTGGKRINYRASGVAAPAVARATASQQGRER